MPRLSFMRHFKDGTPTHFKEKIILLATYQQGESLCKSHGIERDDLLELARNSCMLRMCKEEGLNWKVEMKLHTIRKSAYLQRFVGKEIECFYWEGKPYRSKQIVFEKVRLDGFQEIKIQYSENNKIAAIIIDNKIKTPNESGIISLNDGFNGNSPMLNFFKENFTGYIYHFTKLRY